MLLSLHSFIFIFLLHKPPGVCSRWVIASTRQKPGGLIAKDREIRTRASVTIKTFVYLWWGLIVRLAFPLHQCSKTKSFSALAAKAIPRILSKSFWGVKGAKVTLKRTLCPPSLLFSSPLPLCLLLLWARRGQSGTHHNHQQELSTISHHRSSKAKQDLWVLCVCSHEGSPGAVHTKPHP